MPCDDQIQPSNTQDICTATVSLNTKLHVLPFEHACTPTYEGAPHSVWSLCADLETTFVHTGCVENESLKRIAQCRD